MKIAEEIGQKKPFRNTYHQALVNMMYSHNWLIGNLREFFKQYGITEKQYNILRILNGADKPLTTSIIRNRLLDKMSDTTRVIDRMLKKGIVTKKTNSQDRRLVDISLSDEGSALLKEVDNNTHKIDNLMKALSPEESQQLNTILDKLRSNPTSKTT